MMTLTTLDEAPATLPISDAEQASAWLEDNAAGDIVLNPEGWLLDCNRAAARMFRLPDDYDGRGLNIRQFCRVPERFVETVQALQVTGRLENWDGDFVALDGTPIHVVVNLVGNFDEHRGLASIRAHLFNITEWRRGHERALFGERIETIGRLAGGIAHDFNNLLTVISGHAECLAMALPPDDPMLRSIAAIQESAGRAATLTQKLLAFGRRQVLQARVVDPSELVLTVEADVRRTFGRRILVSAAITRPLWPVRVDPVQIERALGTIAAHAVDSMVEGGAVTFRLENLDVGLQYPQARSFVQRGRYVRIEVACAGMALDMDAQVRVFEPFFTSKGSPRDGMGLAAVFGLVKQSGGYIWLDSERAMETTFTLLLPADEAAAAVVVAESKRLANAVLVVDDDHEVRGLIVKILRHQGFTVHEAGTADAGTEICNTHEIDLLISDVVLDGVRGDEFAAGLLASRPDLKLMCISGYPESQAIRGLDPARAVFLEKPFSAKELVERVRELLAR
jgi:two-component system cell cycle sensor histidine kinase/response regulator CckA